MGLAGLRFTITREKKNVYILAAFGILALKELLFLSPLPPDFNRYIDPVMAVSALIFLSYGFMYHEDRKPLLKRLFNINLTILVFLVLLAVLFKIVNFSAGYNLELILFRLWKIILLAAPILLFFRWRIEDNVSLAIGYGLWLFSSLFPKMPQDIKGIMLTFSYLAFFFTLYKGLLKDFNRINLINQSMLREKEVTLSFLERIGVALHGIFDLEEVLKMIMNCVISVSNASAGAIFLISDNKKELTVETVEGLFPPLHKTSSYVSSKAKYIMERFKAERIKVGEGIVGEVAKTGNPILIKKAENDPRVPEVSTDFLKIKTMVITPLKIKEEVVGVIALVNKKDDTRFTEMDDAMLRALGSQAAVSINNAKIYKELSVKERMERELQIAKDIQQFILPKDSPHVEGFDIVSLYRSAMEVGGDYYDYVQVSENELGIVIGDVSGKGVPGALVMAMVRSILQAIGIGNHSTKDVLSKLNKHVCNSLKTDMFVSIFYCILDTKNRTLTYSRAGHDPLILLPAGKSDHELLTTNGIAIGLSDPAVFSGVIEEKTVHLAPDDIVLFYTDGITEAMNEKQEEFGFDRLIKVITLNRALEAKDISAKVDEEVTQFAGNMHQHDDITMVVLKAR